LTVPELWFDLFVIWYGSEWKYVNSPSFSQVTKDLSLHREKLWRSSSRSEEAEADYVNSWKWSKNGVVNSVYCYRSSSCFAFDHNFFGAPHLIHYPVSWKSQNASRLIIALLLSILYVHFIECECHILCM